MPERFLTYHFLEIFLIFNRYLIKKLLLSTATIFTLLLCPFVIQISIPSLFFLVLCITIAFFRIFQLSDLS